MFRAADGVARLAAANPEVALTVGHFDWPGSALARLPEGVTRIDLSEEEGPG